MALHQLIPDPDTPSQASPLNSIATHFLVPSFSPDPYSPLILPAFHGRPEAIVSADVPMRLRLLAFESILKSPDWALCPET